jgi:glutamate-1-semialdehyde aminotransferase
MPPKPSNPTSKDLDDAIQATNDHLETALRATHLHIDERFQASNQNLESQLHLMQTRMENQDQLQASRHESLKTYLAELITNFVYTYPYTYYTSNHNTNFPLYPFYSGSIANIHPRY